jgi:hypothetical protein
LQVCFYRRRKYPLGSEDRAHTVGEARLFLRAYRHAMQFHDDQRKALLIAEALEIPVPLAVTLEEWQEWVAWWEPSYKAALAMSDEHKAYLNPKISCQPLHVARKPSHRSRPLHSPRMKTWGRKAG